MAIPQKSATATGKVRLGNVSGRNIGRWAIQVSGTFTATYNFVGFLSAPGLTASNDVDVAYTTPTSATLTVTDLTAGGVFYVVADGLDIAVNVEAYTNGTILIDAIPLDG